MTDGADIRPFDESREEDYAAAVCVLTAAFPDHPRTVAAMQDSDARREPKCRNARWLAFSGPEPIGYASYSQSPWAYNAHHFGLLLVVIPDRRGHGIGGRMHAGVLRALEPFQPQQLRTFVREDDERALRFAVDRGFIEVMRDWESRLDVRTFDPAAWGEARARPAHHGIGIRSYAELADDPDRDVRLHALISCTFPDIPSTVPLAVPPFERWREQTLLAPRFLPDGLMIAVDLSSGDYVGSSEVTAAPVGAHLNTGLTAVLPEYRRKGIALALKLRVLDYAISVSAPEVRTDNATTNTGMLAINAALGFIRQPASIILAKTLGTQEQRNQP
jgi:GNAT superfamily N-acetyltransferase